MVSALATLLLHAAGVTEIEWWRDERPPEVPSRDPSPAPLLTGRLGALPDIETGRHGERGLHFFKAALSDTELWLNDAHLSVEWSEFTDCHIRQRVKQVTNDHGFSAQGSFANHPELYRNCAFERVRFKQLGGFNLGRGWFEGCTFVKCRWEGHLAREASLVNCIFIGPMNGCMWFGHWEDKRNVIRENDFTQVQFTNNVAWRSVFPVSGQR